MFDLCFDVCDLKKTVPSKNRENAVKLRRGSLWHGKFDEDKSNISQDIEQRWFTRNGDLESRSRLTICKLDLCLGVSNTPTKLKM